MGKKAGIVTMYYECSPNYGNRLQNYAVKRVLEKRKMDTVTYNFQNREIDLEKQVRYLAHILTGFRLTGDKRYWKVIFRRQFRFERFSQKYIRTARIEKTSDIREMDYYVIGSDQVWNPIWYEPGDDLLKEMYFLDFAEPRKRVCMAPSFGIEQLPEEWKPFFREKLKRFPMLSVREEAGARIIKELTGQDAFVMVDPTMLLTKEEWRKISRRPRGVKEGYILTYFLSEKTTDAKRLLGELRGEKNVYELLNPDCPLLEAADPSEFLWLFDHADLVLTDSFHACVFSFLFGKPFVVFDRNLDGVNMNSRLGTLLTKFHLERKYAASGLENDIWEHDYTQGYQQLEVEREKAMEFLSKSLGDRQ